HRGFRYCSRQRRQRRPGTFQDRGSRRPRRASIFEARRALRCISLSWSHPRPAAFLAADQTLELISSIQEKRMIKVTVMYPNTAGARFNHEYYRDKHMPLVK